ncbi:GNAT family acetyltransferase [Henriciella sp.]|uniref:GNAT family acetyltransferase n=1 Tax=Henriciella sp. TaxID=1968823 RepID=UPI00262CC2A8|nr:GNAT family acetyltransferase [Henriciella sp.]
MSAGTGPRPQRRIRSYLNVMSLHVRDFREADRKAVVSLWDACALTRPWNDPDGDIDLALRSREATLLVGSSQDVIVATVMVGHDGHRGWVYYLAVDARHRGHGHGREMMAEAELWLASRRIPKVQLMVRADNADAGHLYETLGYERQKVSVFGKWLGPERPQDG